MTQAGGNVQNIDLIESATIADVDVHVISGLTPETVDPYVEPPHQGWLTNPRTGLKPERDPYMQGKIEPRTHDGPEQLVDELCGDFHVDHPIINPFAGLSKYHVHDLATALMRGYNQALLDHFLDDHDRLRGMIEIAPQKPDAAAEEIDEYGDEDSIVGVWLLSTGASPPLGDPKYDPIYQAAEDNGLPIAYHGAGPGAFHREYPLHDIGMQSMMEIHSLAHPWNQMQTLVSLTVNGAFVKFPDLDFVFLEAGIGWLPYMTFRLNSEYGMRRMEAPLLERSPEEYIRDQVYVSTQPLGEPRRAEHMRSLIDVVGADNIMFASDYPHWDFDHPDGLDRHLREMFDESQRDRVLHGNANEVFGLGIR
jgi:predicted TIM-barrel fold metal-dependent hydrolase